MEGLSSTFRFLGGLMFTTGLAVDLYWYSFWSKNYKGKLLTSGPYKHVRHPFYTGFLVMTVGLALLLPVFETKLLLVITSAVLVVFIPKEEKTLSWRYKKKYEDYKKDVPWRIIPYVY